MYSSNLVMSEEIEDEFYKDGDVTEGQSSINVNIIQDCLDNQNRDGQDEEDVNMNSANDDTFNNNNNEKNKSIPAPIQGEVTSKRHQKLKEQKKGEKEYEGPGRTLTVFTVDEEMKVTKYILGIRG